MSVVIAIKDKNKIWMGCDSQMTLGHIKLKADNKSFCKIWEIPGCHNGLMGSVGYCRDAQVIQCDEQLVDEAFQYKNLISYGYVVKVLVEKVYKTLAEKRCIDKDNNGNLVNTLRSCFIFAYKDQAYLIREDLSVFPIDDYLVCGCGDEIAIGVLENNKKKKPRDRIIEAIRAVAENDCYVDDNIVIACTNQKE